MPRAVRSEKMVLGTAFDWTVVLIVAAWGLAGLLLSVRYFSWEPRG